MNYENYPIKYAQDNIITPHPKSDALLEEYNRQFVKETFCNVPEPAVEEIENRIIINTIDAFYDNDDDYALCQYDCLMMSIADDIDPDKTISRERLNMLLLDKCDGLKALILDVDGVSNFIIAKDIFTISGLIAARLVNCNIDAEICELYANNIAKELSYKPDEIKAVIVEQCEVIDEDIFDEKFYFDDDDDESCPVVIEIHDGNNVGSVDMDDTRDAIKDVLKSKAEQDSFLRIAAKILYTCYNPDHPDQ